MVQWARGLFMMTALAAAVSAAPVTYIATSGSLSASATFANVNGKLVVTLSNNASSVSLPSQVLTALFFDVAGSNPILTPESAILPSGSQTCLNGVCTAATEPNVGGEWAYKAGIAVLGREYGISSTGIDIFGSGNFGGANLAGPDGVDGMQYGLVPVNYTPNGGLANQVVVAKSVAFTLGGLPIGFDPQAMINHVYFQYGTSLSEPRIPGDPAPPPPGVPEPATMAVMGSGLMGLALLRRLKS